MSGDDFTRTVAPHLAEMRERAYWLARNAADADDLVQETLLRAFRFWHTWEAPPDRPDDPRPWLQVIMTRVYCDWQRSARVRKRALTRGIASADPDEISYEPVAVDDDEPAGQPAMVLLLRPQTAALDPANGISDELVDALESLPAKWRNIFRARLDGETVDELSGRFRVAGGTVGSSIYRARRALSHARGVAGLAQREYGMRGTLPASSCRYDDHRGRGRRTDRTTGATDAWLNRLDLEAA